MASLKINSNDRTKSIKSTIATALPNPYMEGFTTCSEPLPHSSSDSTTLTQKGCHPTIFLDTTPEEGNSAAFVLTSKTPSTRLGGEFMEDGSAIIDEEEATEEAKGRKGVMVEARAEDVISAPQTLEQKQPQVESLRAQSPKRTSMRNINDRGISACVQRTASPSSSTTSSRGSPLISTAPPRASTSNSGSSVAVALSLISSPFSMSPQSQLQHRQGPGYTSAGLSRVSSMTAESTQASIGNTPFSGSLPLVISPSSDEYHPHQYQRQSAASSTVAMDTAATMQVLDKMQLGYSSSSERNSVERTEREGERFGAIGAVTMDMTNSPKMNSTMVENDEMKNVFTGYGSVMSRLPPVPLSKTFTKDRERRLSVTHAQHTIDLSRVAEESDKGSSSGDGAQEQWRVGETQRRGEKEEVKVKEKDGKAGGKALSPKRVVHHKEKWSVDFSELFHAHNPSPTPSFLDPQELSSLSSSVPIRTLSHTSHDITGSSPMSRSVSPPRKPAIVSGRNGDEPYSLAPRRPTQSRYHDLDCACPLTKAAPGALSISSNATSGMVPKADPDQIFESSSSAGNHTTKAMAIRRTSAKKNPLPAVGSPSHRTKNNLSLRVRDNWDAAGTPDSYTSRSEIMACGVTTGDLDDGLSGISAREVKKGKESGVSESGCESGAATRGWRDTPVPVPFPRVISGGHPETPLSPGNCNENTATPTNALSNSTNNKDFGPPRRRFQSELSSGGAARPKSYDELGAKPSRMRFESMMNIGRENSARASATDLIARHSFGNAVRETLIVKEEGKPSTHFVSRYYF